MVKDLVNGRTRKKCSALVLGLLLCTVLPLASRICSSSQGSTPTPKIFPHLRDPSPPQGSAPIPGICLHPRDLSPSQGSVPHSRDLPPPHGSAPIPRICSPPHGSVPTSRICPHPRDLPPIPGGWQALREEMWGWENLSSGALGMRPSRFSQLLTHRRSAGPWPNHQDKQGLVS